ncbi:MAG: histidinol dehydrogenase [Bifidobacteriaceae bacterium]|jgi:histidinol dehydrogenase|nr:histidinol dehydrogenase [Bifidobacteriaceae bacterium]
MRRIDLRGRAQALTPSELAAALPRAEMDVAAATEQVALLLADVKARGAAALADQAERFDHVRPPTLKVPKQAIDQAVAALDPTVRQALETAISRTRQVHTAQVPPGGTVTLADGATVTQRWIPVRRVGLYVPGGLAVYPSSVVMNVVPAQAAGVQSLAIASPAQQAHGGLPHPTILAAAGLLGVDEVYAAGGAGAVGLFAYGIPGQVDKVDVITGPGNVWVAAAKRLVRGLVGIDAEAGPTEIGIIADASADPEYVAADLVSQAEHDPLAASVLFTDSADLADAVDQAVERRARATKHSERVITALTGRQSGLMLLDNLDQAVAAANEYGAEHLEIQTVNAAAVAAHISNAGAIFVGPYSPVPLGDYLAGSNHVLPTGGTAKFASGLGVTAFLKSVQQIQYSGQALAEVGQQIVALANDEDLPAHGEAIQARAGR